MSIGRPVALLTLDGSGGGAGGALGAAAAAVGLGAGRLGLAEGAVRRIAVDLSVDEDHDRAQLWLWPGSRLAGAEPGSTLSVGLGAGRGDPVDVLTVQVAGADRGPDGTLLTGFAPSHRLATTWVGRSWRRTTLGQAVRDLLDEGGVDAGDVDAPLALPALHVDPRRSVWRVLHDLAARTGHQVTSRADGAVCFGPAPGAGSGPGGLDGLGGLGGAVPTGGLGGDDELREGADLLRSAVRAGTARTAVARVSPAGAGSWFLLVAAPDDGSAVAVVDPVLRTREAADAGTGGARAAASRGARGARLRVTGRPGLRAGATVRAAGAAYRVLRVRHAVDAAAGYVCDLTLEGDA